MSARIFYHGTGNEVALGDRVEFTTLVLRRKRMGSIVFIPEQTALELANENKEPEDWLLKFDDGTYTGWMYHPEELQPIKRLRLIARTSGPVEEISNHELENLDSQEAGRLPGQVGALLGCLAIVAIVSMAAVVIIRML